MKRSVCLLLAAAMVLGLTVGCKKNQSVTEPDSSAFGLAVSMGDSQNPADLNGEDTPGGENITNSQGGSSSNPGVQGGNKTTGKSTGTSSSAGFALNDRANISGGSVVNNCNTVGYPIANKKVTLSVMIKDYSDLSNYSAMKINTFLKEKMNISVDWIVVSQYNLDERMSLAYTSGNMPDIYMGMAPASYDFHWPYIKQGLITKLDDYMQNMPLILLLCSMKISLQNSPAPLRMVMCICCPWLTRTPTPASLAVCS